MSFIETILPGTLAITILALAAWPLLRFLAIPSIRRQYRRVAFAALALVLLWFVGIAGAALLAPGLLLPAASVAACFLVAERWRARSAFGAGRALPPGSLSLVPRGPWVEEKFYAGQAAKYGPIFKMSQFFRPMVCVMGPSEGVDLLTRHSDRLYSPAVRFSRFIPRGYIRYMAPDDHARYKPLFRAALGSRTVSACSADFRTLVASTLSEISRVSHASTGVHPEAYLTDLGFQCALRLFLGVSGKSPDVMRLRALYRQVEIGKAASGWRARDKPAAGAIADFVSARFDMAGLEPCVLTALRGMPDVDATDRTLLLNLVYMIRISGSDLGGFLTWAVKILADNPYWLGCLHELLAEGRDDQASDLADLMLREMLRLERSEFIFRKARRPIDYKGFRIPRGWIVRICIRDGHRDPDVFADPDTFDPMRFRKQRYGKRQYSPLGIGAHACPGGQVINAVGRLLLLELASRYRMSVLADGGREYGRSHWQPAASWRIVLTATGGPATPLPR